MYEVWIVEDLKRTALFVSNQESSQLSPERQAFLYPIALRLCAARIEVRDPFGVVFDSVSIDHRDDEDAFPVPSRNAAAS